MANMWDFQHHTYARCKVKGQARTTLLTGPAIANLAKHSRSLHASAMHRPLHASSMHCPLHALAMHCPIKRPGPATVNPKAEKAAKSSKQAKGSLGRSGRREMLGTCLWIVVLHRSYHAGKVKQDSGVHCRLWR
eukprot:scaffold99909_cov30-Tisochrysis_lutea.AAC.1